MAHSIGVIVPLSIGNCGVTPARIAISLTTLSDKLDIDAHKHLHYKYREMLTVHQSRYQRFFQNISQAQGCCFQRFCCSHNEGIEIPAGFLIACLDDAFVSCDTDDFLNRLSLPYRPHERTAWYHRYSVRVDGAPDVAFVGKLLAECDASP